MAKLKLTLYNVEYNDSKSGKSVTGEISLYTDKGEATVALTPEAESSATERYILSLVDFKFQKKMYQPTEIIAKIQISLADTKSTEVNTETWKPVSKKVVEKLFSDKKVSLSSLPSDSQEDFVGEDYYVKDVKVNYKPTSMFVTLGIYSLDKLLTLHFGSQAFVSKKLGDEILPTVLENVTAPYDSEKKMEGLSKNMNVLRRNNTEHIFPYLVQYNESVYDMLARTANRWGEFMFYEDGALNLGYDKTQTPTPISDWADLKYCDLDSGMNSDKAEDSFDAEAAYSSNIMDSPLPKSPDVIKNLAGCSPANGLDVWIMKKVASFLGNTGNIPKWIGNQLFDDLYNRALAERNSKTVNDDNDSKYFEEQTEPEKYGMHEFKDLGKNLAFNPFTELHSPYDKKLYRLVLKGELAAAHEAVHIKFDTTYPNLKLGQIIKVNGDQFIVNEIEGKIETVLDYKVEESQVVVVKTTKLVFEVIGLAQNADTNFYPMMLPAGHFRYSPPQLATVLDADDPLNQNRVRVYFPWQKNEDDGDSKDLESIATPWLVYATSAASKSNGIYGKHYEGDEVLVNFANGNVENPYVVGGLAMKGNKVPGSLAERDIVLSSPGGHTLRMDDGSGAGLAAFLAGALTPGYELVTTFLPGTAGFDFTYLGDKTKNFEGGFQLTDKYGIYTISGSTDERNVSIKSPWGDVSINAFTGISISAPNGDIEIKGKNVKIEAGNNLELVSGTNIGSSWRPHKDTIGGGLAQVGTDIMAAVTKKLSEKIVTLVDLSILRSMFEIVVRPIEGATVVKSNRYLKLETGDDECDYPDTSYAAAFNNTNVEKSKDKIREGLLLTDGVAALISKVKAIVSDIDDDYRSRYNKCVKEQRSFKRAIENAKIYANEFDSNNNNSPDLVCKSLADNLAVFWKEGDYQPLTEADLGFTDKYKVDGLGDVDDDAIENYWLGRNLTNVPEEQQKRPIINARIKHRRKILSAANDLRKAICKMKAFKKLDEKQITRKIGWNYGTSLFKDYKSIMTSAFTKAADVSIYYKKIEGDRQKLENELTKADSQVNRKVMRRVAAIFLLEGLGFQDAWRDDVANKPAPKTAADSSNDNKWNNYAGSLKAFPPLEGKDLALNKAFADPFAEVKEGINPFQVVSENKVWENSKKGSILYTYDGSTYTLGNSIDVVEENNIPKAKVAAAEVGSVENLVADDNENKDVKKSLNYIMDRLKTL